MIDRNKVMSYATLIILLISALPLAIQITSENVSAAPDTHTWDGGGADAFAGTHANWVGDVAPVAGDSIVFDNSAGGGALPCTWNLSIALASFTISAGYSGTITQGASFDVTTYAQAGGTLTGSASYTLTVNGNFIQTAGAVTDGTLKLVMQTPGSTLTWSASTEALTTQFKASTTITDGAMRTRSLTVDASVVVNIVFTYYPLNVKFRVGSTYSNLGTISGTGNFNLYFVTTDMTILPGTIAVNLLNVLGDSGMDANRVLMLSGASTSITCPLSISSSHASRTMTLDTSASNYALSATSITIGTRGILNGRGSTITSSGNWDSSAGTFTPGTSSVHLTGASKTLKTAGTGFSNLFVDGTYTLQSNVKTWNYWKNGTLALGGYTLTVNNDQAPEFTTTPSILTFNCGDPYYYAASAYDREGTSLTYGLTTDLPGLEINTTTGAVTRSAAEQIAGTYLMDISVTDGNHTVWQNYTLTVTNDLPYFTTSPILSIVWTDDYSYDADATDPEGYSIIFSLTSDMPSLIINSTTGVVSKAHFVGNGTFYVDVSVSDGNYTVWQNYSLEVINLCPVIISYPRLTLVQGTGYFYLVIATDPEGSDVTVNISTSAPWITVNLNGSISGTPLPRDIGVWRVNVSAWDGYRTTYDNYTIQVTALDIGTMSMIMLLLAFAFGFGLIFMGFKKNEFWILAGIVWVFCGLTIFISYGVVFLLVSVGLGIVLMFKGVSPYL